MSNILIILSGRSPALRLRINKTFFKLFFMLVRIVVRHIVRAVVFTVTFGARAVAVQFTIATITTPLPNEGGAV